MCKSTFSRMLSLSLFLLVLSPVPFVILPKISLDPSCLYWEREEKKLLTTVFICSTNERYDTFFTPHHIIISSLLVESNNKNKCWFQPSLCWSCEYRRSDWNSSKIENEPQTRDRSLHITFQRSYRRWRFMWKLFPRSLICLLSAAAPTHRTCRVHRERV